MTELLASHSTTTWEMAKFVLKTYVGPVCVVGWSAMSLFSQVRKVYLEKKGEVISVILPFILVCSNSMRILFWVGARFELYLLLQSCVMSLLLLLLIYLTLFYRDHWHSQDVITKLLDKKQKNQSSPFSVDGGELQTPKGNGKVLDSVPKPQHRHNFSIHPPLKSNPSCSRLIGDDDHDWHHEINHSLEPHEIGSADPIYYGLDELGKRFEIFDLWKFFEWPEGWVRQSSYWVFLYIFIAINVKIFMFLWLCLKNKVYLEILGIVAMSLEGIASLPQVLQNFSKHQMDMSRVMVAMNIVSDICKICFFSWSGAPFQFVMCGCIQLSLNAILVMQYCCFAKNSNPASAIQPDPEKAAEISKEDSGVTMRPPKSKCKES